MGQKEFLDDSQVSAKLYLKIFGLWGSQIYHNEIKVAENHSVKRDLSRTQANSLRACEVGWIDNKGSYVLLRELNPMATVKEGLTDKPITHKYPKIVANKM